MRRKIPLVLLVLLACSAHAADLKTQPFREWVDNTGTHRIKARLMNADSAAKSVQLKLDSGQTVDLPIRRLSAADRRYVNSLVASSTKNSGPANVANIAGINWIENLNDARRIAAAGRSPKDDKPVMCFRALGDLTGFM